MGSDTVSKFEASIPHGPPDEAFLVARRNTLATWNLDVSYVDDIALAISAHADDALFLCSVVCFGKFDYTSTSPLEKPRFWWMPSVLVRVLYFGSLHHACVQCQLC